MKMQHKKFYGLFKILKDGTILGYTEHSFSMSWSRESVRKYRKKDIDYIFEKKLISQYNKEPGSKIIVVRISAHKLPLPIIVSLKPKNVGKSKFYRRNSPFKQINPL